MNKTLIRITTAPISLELLLQGQMEYMRKNGFRVVMVSADGSNVKKLKEQEFCEHIIVPFTRKITPLLDLYCLYKLIRIFIHLKPTIVHTHTPKAGLLGMLAAKFCNIPVRIHTIAGLPLMTATGWKKQILLLTEKITAWGAHKVLPNSPSLLNYILNQNILRKGKLGIIGHGSSNGIDLNRYSRNSLSPQKLKDYKSNLAIKKSDKVILFVGRLVRDKGIVELIDTFLLLNKLNQGFRLLLIGPFEDERRIEVLPDATIAEIKKNPSIDHVSWSDEVEYFMALSDILVHPSHREGFPNVLLQAGSMLLPIICSNIPGNIDLVENNKKGLIFELKNVQELYKKILFAFNNYKVMGQYADELRIEIEKKFERGFVHEQILKLYNESLYHA